MNCVSMNMFNINDLVLLVYRQMFSRYLQFCTIVHTLAKVKCGPEENI